MRRRARSGYSAKQRRPRRFVTSRSLCSTSPLTDWSQAERTKKKKGFQAPVHPFARQTKAARKKAAAAAVASTSATTLDGGAEEGGDEPPKKKKKVAIDPALYAPQRESTRRTAVESRRQVQERLKETEQRKVRCSRVFRLR